MLNNSLSAVRLRTSAACLFIAVVFIAVRLPALNPEQSFLSLSSDNAIYALMAQDILSEGKIPVYFYGQNYQGPLTSIVIAGIQKILEGIGFEQIAPGTASPYVISPITISLASMLMVLTGIMCFSLFVRRLYGNAAALIFAVLMSIGHSMLMMISLRPLGAEMAFLAGSWIALAMDRWIRKRDPGSLFLAGICAGVGWWINEMTVFVLLPFILWFAIKQAARVRVWKPLRLRDRFLLSGQTLEFRTLPWWTRVLGVFIHGILAVNFIGGLIAAWLGGWNTVIFGIRLKVNNGLSPIKISIFLFLLIQVVWWWASSAEARSASLSFLKKIRPGLAGFLAGYSPVWLGAWLGWYERSYGAQFKIIAAHRLPGHAWNAAVTFLPGFLLSSNHPLVVIAFWIFMPAVLAYGVVKLRKTPWREWLLDGHSLQMIPWIMAVGNLSYMFVADRVYGALVPRYALFTLVGFCMILADAGKRFWLKPLPSQVVRGIRKAVAVLAFLFLGMAYYLDGKDTIRQIYAQPDPRLKVQELIASGYHICYADYWFAYKYEYLTNRNVLFIPYHSEDRTPKRSRRLADLPERKCLILKNEADRIIEFKESN
jgi:hypothetical protein